MRITPIVLGLGAMVLSCATLNAVTADSCGNGVVEDGEDCDSTSAMCGAPAADAAHACHFVCTKSTDCKVGSCSASGICRQPTGTFAGIVTNTSTNVTSLLAGDFDGDKHTDIIGLPPYGSAGASRVHYFDDSSGLATTMPLDLPIPLATVKDLDGDQIDDVGFAIRNLGFGAFGALRGQQGRSFATYLYPAVTFEDTDAKWAVVTNSDRVKLPGTVPSCAFGLLNGEVASGAPNRIISLCNGSSGTAGVFNFPIALLPSNLVGEVAAGVIDRALSSCGQLVFATNPPVVTVVSLCAGENWRDGVQAPAISQPTNVKVAQSGDTIVNMYVGPVRSLDTDDILIQMRSGDVWMYDKAGSFVAAPGLAKGSPLPLASGDLNGDKIVDYVFPGGITLSDPISLIVSDAGTGPLNSPDAGTTSHVAPRDNLTWKYAKIGRFNDDDLLDVLVSYDGQLDIDVLGNSGDGRFTPFTVRTDQLVRRLGAGDFDGDRIDDLAFLQSNVADDEGAADLYIAFGSPTGAPEAAHLVGSLKNAHALVSLKDSAIGVDDLSVIGRTPPSATQTGNQASVTVLFGTGGRTAVAPLFMIDDSQTQTDADAGSGTSTAKKNGGNANDFQHGAESAHYWQPTSFSIGPFVNAGALQIVSIAAGYQYTPTAPQPFSDFSTGAWFAAHDDNAVGNLLPFQLATPLSSFVPVDYTALLEGGKLQLESVTASGDIDYPVDPKAEIDELVTVTKATLDPTQAVVFVVRPGTGQNGTTIPVVTARIPNAEVVGSDPVQIVDVDGDHDPDVVFIITADGVRKLMILRGDGKGNFADPVTVAVPTDVVTFAPIDVGKPHLELAVVTPTKVLLASLDGVVDISPSGAGQNHTGLTVGDFNGDGVRDIALADHGTILLMPQNYVVNGRHP